MLFSNRAVRILFEGLERVGIDREDLTRPLGLDPAQLIAKGAVEWSTIAALGNELSTLFDDDQERLRALGRDMIMTPTLRPMRGIAKSVVSVRALFGLSVRWVFPAVLPHLVISHRFVTSKRMVMRCEIPEPHAENRAFFPIFEGAVMSLPELIGHPRGVLESRTVTPRTIELVIAYPKKLSISSRAERAFDALLDAPRVLSALEKQRKEFADNIRALQNARDELRVVLERLPDFVCIHAADGTILWVNPALALGLGYADGSEIVGTSVLDLVAPECSAKATLALARPIDATSTHLTEWVLRGKTGQDVMVELAPTQTVVFDGLPARLIVGRDVTERVRMQQKLLVADRLASVGLLAAGVAHEVNNPLGYILNNIELASKSVSADPEATERRRQVLATALEGVDRIRIIVRDLLLLSRGDEGPLTPLDVGAVARSTLALAAPEVERSARLVCEFGPAPLVLASSARISQVLLNLIGNALEAMRMRAPKDSTLTVRIQRAAGDRLLLEVSDTGTGIPEAAVSRVFEPFFTTKPAGKGTGLGLAIAQKLVVEMGGEISVTSDIGRGTTFRVLLPAAARLASEDVSRPPHEYSQP